MLTQEFTHSTPLEHYLVQPIADHLFRLQQRYEEHYHSAITLEISYCASLIPDLFRLLQSYAGSLHEALERQPADVRIENSLRDRCGDELLALDVEEMRCLRDAIEHTHLWHRQICFTVLQMDPFQTEVEYSDFTLRAGGDTRFNRVVDRQRGKTRRLGLNAIPTQTRATDMLIILGVVTRALAALERVMRAQVQTEKYHPFYPSEARVAYGPSPTVTFQEASNAFLTAEKNRSAPGPT
jgi:hypothetical protein